MTGVNSYWLWLVEDLRDPRWQIGRMERMVLRTETSAAECWLRLWDWATDAFRSDVQRVPPEATKSTYVITLADERFSELVANLRAINTRLARAVNDARFAAMAEVEALGAMYVPENPQPADSEGDE